MAIYSYILVVLFISYYIDECTSAAPTLQVLANAGQHPISPYIYGLNYNSDPAFAKQISLPFTRLGGNAMTRYNWKIDVSNHASDWFFENLAGTATNLPDGNQANTFVETYGSVGTRSMLTIPLIGWTPIDRTLRCGFSVKKYGAQQSTDQFQPDCGNGMRTDGKTPVTGNSPTDTSVAINSTFATQWVQYLVNKFGPASKSGVLFYEMDNEYDLWPSTHRDVSPNPVGTDQIISLTEQYASAVKAADPSALTLGPVGWGFESLLFSSLDQHGNTGGSDKAAHGNIDFGSYYLQAMKSLEAKHGIRLLDYYDNHYYPQSPSVDATRLESTRSLWDPTYTDDSWINTQIQLIPRIRGMIAKYYPGTKIAFSEYNWGALNTLNGALAQADVLGIFGREGVDLASVWGPTATTDPWAYAFMIYRNYDGNGSQFGDTSVNATSSNQSELAIYASTRSSDKHLIIVVINKDPTQVFSTSIAITGFTPSGTASVYTYSSANLSKIVRSSTSFSGTSLPYTFPAYSITLFDLPPK